MISALMVLNSAYPNSRDITWTDCPDAKLGYNLYRAYDAPVNWQRINTSPIQGTFFRDQTTYDIVRFPVTANDWADQNQAGGYVVKIPSTPYADPVGARPVLASPQDVQVEVAYPGGVTKVYPVAKVDALDRSVWLRVDSVLEGNGAVSRTPLIDYSTAVSFTILYRHLSNRVDLDISGTRTFYTVTAIGATGAELTPPGLLGSPVTDSYQIDQMDFAYRTMVEYNGFLFSQVAEPALLFIQKTLGVRCDCATGVKGHGRTACPSCYETGWVGGYLGPFDFPFIDPDTALMTTVSESGREVERQSRSYCGPSPMLRQGDMIVRRNGERLVIETVTRKSPRGVLLQQDFDVNLIKPGDTRYLVPIQAPDRILIYNPASDVNPVDGVGIAEPLFRADTVPGKQWENPDVQLGRTLTWGKLQT